MTIKSNNFVWEPMEKNGTMQLVPYSFHTSPRGQKQSLDENMALFPYKRGGRGSNAGPPYHCEICGRPFNHTSNLANHRIKLHNFRIREKSFIGCIAMGCSRKFVSHQQLIKHCNEEHETTIRIQEVAFTTLDDFYSWKAGVESASGVRFITHQAKKNGKIKYFRCNRDGKPRERLRLPGIQYQRTATSLSVHRICFAYMRLLTEKDRLLVTFCNYHTHDVGSAANSLACTNGRNLDLSTRAASIKDMQIMTDNHVKNCYMNGNGHNTNHEDDRSILENHLDEDTEAKMSNSDHSEEVERNGLTVKVEPTSDVEENDSMDYSPSDQDENHPEEGSPVTNNGNEHLSSSKNGEEVVSLNCDVSPESASLSVRADNIPANDVPMRNGLMHDGPTRERLVNNIFGKGFNQHIHNHVNHHKERDMLEHISHDMLKLHTLLWRDEAHDELEYAQTLLHHLVRRVTAVVEAKQMGDLGMLYYVPPHINVGERRHNCMNNVTGNNDGI